ncbi:hypothetical protein OS493_017342 [Desmophyllum pertusum]|uniref:Uncharacterized protein n=1 Tax=Desmophyllum pertusum TaxID=174260 RepID=A0A9X0A237_9CNID|nr:hypothetical protein OS493_017342 [Desmophyllum pertusum]
MAQGCSWSFGPACCLLSSTSVARSMPRCNDITSIQVEQPNADIEALSNIQNCYLDVVGWFVWVDGPVDLWSFGILFDTGSNLARQAIGRVFSLKPVSSRSSRSGFEYEADNLTHTNESHRTTRNLQLIGC